MPGEAAAGYLAREMTGREELIQLRVREALATHPDPDTLRLRWERLRRSHPSADRLWEEPGGPEREALLALLALGDAPVDEVVRSPHLLPPLLVEVRGPDPFTPAPDPRRSLALFKRLVWSKILLRERLGLASLPETLSALTRLADEIARAAFARAGGPAPPVALWALGKWGGGELNASSDIDPVFFSTGEAGGEEADGFVRRWLAALLPPREPEIYRVDLRLRPEGEAGALAPGYRSLERYLFQRAAPWERIAWLRARPVAGPVPPWVEEMLGAFLFPPGGNPADRFAEVARSLAGVHRAARPRDVKRSPGGIRAVEFLVAAQQLAEGRSDPGLRRGTILDLLDRLEERGLLSAGEIGVLRDAYTLWRRVENALQAEEDRACFIVPEPGTPAHGRLAFALGATAEEFERRFTSLLREAETVVRRRLLEVAGPGVAGAVFDPQAEPGEVEESFGAGARGLSVLRRLGGRWGTAGELLDSELLREAPEVDEALLRFESVVNGYGGAAAWKAAVGQSPALRREATRLIVLAPRLVMEAVARPYLWERLGWEEWPLEVPEPEAEKALSAHLGDFLFFLGVRFLRGGMTAGDLTASWSREVDRVLLRLLERGFAGETQAALLALGKWGGGELAPDADLDVVLVCGDTRSAAALEEVQRRGYDWLERAALGGRLTLDPRLRPEGGSAPLVVTLSRMEEYLAGRASPWEKIAFARARFIGGDPEVGRRAEGAMTAFAALPPGPSEWGAVRKARRKAEQLSRPRAGVLRIKKGRGGMMDYEFAAAFAGWNLSLPPGPWWRLPLGERLESLAGSTGDERWMRARAAYGELRRWELALLLSSAHRRGEVTLRGGEAQPVLRLLGWSGKELEVRWREIAALGRELYEAYSH